MKMRPTDGDGELEGRRAGVAPEMPRGRQEERALSSDPRPKLVLRRMLEGRTRKEVGYYKGGAAGLMSETKRNVRSLTEARERTGKQMATQLQGCMPIRLTLV